VYRHWWFWTLVGAAAVGAAAGVYAASSGGPAVPTTSLGNVDIR
jgi:hypothetical protein